MKPSERVCIDHAPARTHRPIAALPAARVLAWNARVSSTLNQGVSLTPLWRVGRSAHVLAVSLRSVAQDVLEVCGDCDEVSGHLRAPLRERWKVGRRRDMG